MNASNKYQQVQHVPPNTINWDRVGVISGLPSVDLEDVRQKYYKGRVPRIHPLVIYEVGAAGVEDRVAKAHISLSEIRMLVVGTHHLFVESEYLSPRDPTQVDIEEALQHVRMFGEVEYSKTKHDASGDARKNVQQKVKVTKQIEDILLLHLAFQSGQVS